MKPCLRQPESNLIEFTSLRAPDIIFMQSYAQLIAMGIRHDIARSLASYSAFQERPFNPNSSILVHVHEETGQEPSAQGNEPLVNGAVAA